MTFCSFQKNTIPIHNSQITFTGKGKVFDLLEYSTGAFVREFFNNASTAMKILIWHRKLQSGGLSVQGK